MRNGFIGAIVVTALVTILGPSSSTVSGQASRPASDPDISGVWARRPPPPPIPGAPAAGPDFLSDSRKPEPAMTPWAEAEYKANKTPERTGWNDPVFNCFPPGLPRVYSVDLNGAMEIIQIPGRVLQIFEFDHHVRQIFTDGRKHDENQAATWLGDSIGKWEGDTLVVDTVNFNDKTRLDRLGHPHTDALHLVERFRRVNRETLAIDITIEDSKAYTKPWGGRLIYGFKPDWKITEFMCQDNHTFDEFREKAAKKP